MLTQHQQNLPPQKATATARAKGAAVQISFASNHLELRLLPKVISVTPGDAMALSIELQKAAIDARVWDAPPGWAASGREKRTNMNSSFSSVAYRTALVASAALLVSTASLVILAAYVAAAQHGEHITRTIFANGGMLLGAIAVFSGVFFGWRIDRRKAKDLEQRGIDLEIQLRDVQRRLVWVLQGKSLSVVADVSAVREDARTPQTQESALDHAVETDVRPLLAVVSK
jgi:hypothetical protein